MRDTQADVPSTKRPRAQLAFKDSMVLEGTSNKPDAKDLEGTNKQATSRTRRISKDLEGTKTGLGSGHVTPRGQG